MRALPVFLVLALLQAWIANVAGAAPLSARPQMAIGFDDSPQAPAPLLAILQQKGVKATFFVVGELADADPVQARSIASAGMLIGNHSYDHPDFTTATAGEIYDNLAHAQSAIYADTGVTPHWYRSPFLAQNPAYDTVLPQLGLKISWPDIDPRDWAGTAPQDIINLVRDQEFPGAVVELHDMNTRTNTIQALPALIDGLHADGYDLVTLDDIGLGAIEGTTTEKGGSALGGVLVSAYDSLGSRVATASSNAGGHYRLARLAPGHYRVGFSRAAHASTYYDSAGNLASATPVAVSGDHTIAGVSAALQVVLPPPPVPITLATTTRLSGPSVARVKKLLRLVGAVSPSAAPGRIAITITRLKGNKWTRVGTARVVLAHGTFAYRYKPWHKGRWHFVASYSGGLTGATTYEHSQSTVTNVRVR